MKLATIDIDHALGGILIHNVADAQGHKALPKGHQLCASDVEKLRALGKNSVVVALLDHGDVRENEAAVRIATAVAGEHLEISAVSGGRVNLFATAHGLVMIKGQALERINMIKGVTVATIPQFARVQPKKMVATVKTIGLAVPESSLRETEEIGQRADAVISVRPFRPLSVAVVLTGSPEARGRVERTFDGPISSRVQELGGEISQRVYVEHESQAVADAIRHALRAGAQCIILAGETSIMDESDVTPTGILIAGGRIEVYGAPVEPGNLFLLGYADAVPLIGAPGCVKSRDTNVVDLVLPRLFAGEHVTRADVVALANGGLLI